MIQKYSQSFPISIEKGLTKALIVRYSLEYITVGRNVTDRPLPQSRAAQPKDITSGYRYAVFLQASLDLVVRKESHVTRMRHCEDFPVS